MRRVFIKIIEIYKNQISPFIGVHCKYEPTCSEYTKQAIEKYGVVKGIFIGMKRIIRCNPLTKGGYDPLK